jgi:hypothetical protein
MRFVIKKHFYKNFGAYTQEHSGHQSAGQPKNSTSKRLQFFDDRINN